MNDAYSDRFHDVIRLIGLGGVGRHGVLEEERRDGQTFLADVVLHVDTRDAGASDDLDHTVDYAALAHDVVAVLEGEPVNLIETLAARIADAALSRELVQAVEVTVHKPEAPVGVPFTDVQVTIHRTRAAHAAPAVAPDEPVAEAQFEGVPAVAAEEPVSVGSPAEDDADLLTRIPDTPVDVVLGLGGNVGDVRSTLRSVVEGLKQAAGVEVVRVSPLARTAAVLQPDALPQPDHLNAVVLATTTLSPMDLLQLTHRLEDAHGRRRRERWGERTVDIDIITYDGVTSADPTLTLPHPRANERAFVLVPWGQADPTAYLPGLGGGPVALLSETAPDRDGVRWLALDWLDSPGGSGSPAPAEHASVAAVRPDGVAGERASVPEPWPAPTPGPGPGPVPEPGPAPVPEPGPVPEPEPGPAPEPEPVPAPEPEPVPDPWSSPEPVPTPEPEHPARPAHDAPHQPRPAQPVPRRPGVPWAENEDQQADKPQYAPKWQPLRRDDSQ